MPATWFTKNARREGKAVRLVRVLSQRGLASRRTAEEWIRAGRVSVNGRPVSNPQLGVHPELDTVLVDPSSPSPGPTAPSTIPPAPSTQHPAPAVFWILHKPAGCLTAVRDPQGRRTVYDFLPKGLPWMAPVGRLDADSSGLLLFTNATAVSAALRDPARAIPKVYEVTVRGPFPPERLKEFDRAIPLGGGEVARPARVRRLDRAAEGDRLELTLTEGKKREVRRMMKRLGFEVVRLHRVVFGPIRLGDLKEGNARVLNDAEIEALTQALRR